MPGGNKNRDRSKRPCGLTAPDTAGDTRPHANRLLPLVSATAHWREFARQFVLLDTPLRPNDEDIRLLTAMLAASDGKDSGARRPRTLLLGVTPEIANADYLRTTELLAVDRVPAMIELAWTGNSASRQAICGDWLHLPLPDASIDLALGDGCLTAVRQPDELASLLDSLQRCLRGEGRLLLRLFCRPDRGESPDAVIAALLAGEIGNFHAFKWRLAMALQGEAGDIAVDAVWRRWQESGVDGPALAAARGWSPEVLETIAFYRDSPARYNFMRFDETVAVLDRHGFDLEDVRSGDYELAERCPQALFRKRRDER